MEAALQRTLVCFCFFSPFETGPGWPLTHSVGKDCKLLVFRPHLLWCWSRDESLCLLGKQPTEQHAQPKDSASNTNSWLNRTKVRHCIQSRGRSFHQGTKGLLFTKISYKNRPRQPHPKNKGLTPATAHGNSRPRGRLTGMPARHRAGTDHPPMMGDSSASRQAQGEWPQTPVWLMERAGLGRGWCCRLGGWAGVTAGRCHGRLPGFGSPSRLGEGHLAETSRSAGMGPGTTLCSFSARSEKKAEERKDWGTSSTALPVGRVVQGQGFGRF